MAVGVVEFSLQKFNMFSTHNHLVLTLIRKILLKLVYYMQFKFNFELHEKVFDFYVCSSSRST